MGFLSLNSNIAALKAQRALASSQDRLNQTLQRLSSGQRINSASDDAAGLSIADNLRVQSRLYGVATRNINDALSAMNIISSTLDEQTTILQRLYELAQQSSNGTLTSGQRRTLNKEYRSLVSEFARLGDTTQFNGVNLTLGGRGSNPSALTVQAGVKGDSNSSLSVALTDSGSFSGKLNLDELSFPAPGKFSEWITTNWGLTDFSIDQIQASFGSALFQTTGVDSSGRTREVLVAAGSPTDDGHGAKLIAFVQSLSDPDAWQNTIDVDDLLNYVSDTFTVTFNSQGKFNQLFSGSLANQDGTRLNLDLRGLVATGSTFGTTGHISFIEASNVLSQSYALQAMDVIARRLDDLSSSKGQMGAAGSRLQVALSTMGAARENSVAAESRIRDVDVAMESAKLVAERIRQQTAAQVLGLANQQPSLLLALLSP